MTLSCATCERRGVVRGVVHDTSRMGGKPTVRVRLNSSICNHYTAYLELRPNLVYPVSAVDLLSELV